MFTYIDKKTTRPGARLSGEIRREQIAQAVLRIIARRGVKALTTASIAEEVGISEANLYRHFRNKEEILYATVEKIGEGLSGNIEKVMAMPAASPIARLGKLFRMHLEYIESNDGIPRLIFSEELHIDNEKLRKKFLNIINSYSFGVKALIREAQEAGLIKKEIDPEALVLMFTGLIQALTMRWSLSGFSFSLTGRGVKLWKNLERCMQKA